MSFLLRASRTATGAASAGRRAALKEALVVVGPGPSAVKLYKY